MPPKQRKRHLPQRKSVRSPGRRNTSYEIIKNPATILLLKIRGVYYANRGYKLCGCARCRSCQYGPRRSMVFPTLVREEMDGINEDRFCGYERNEEKGKQDVCNKFCSYSGYGLCLSTFRGLYSSWDVFGRLGSRILDMVRVYCDSH